MQKRPKDNGFCHWVDGGIDSNGDELICRDANERMMYTPDFPELRVMKMVPVFVYDNMMSDQSHHYMINGAVYFGRGHTMTDFYEMKSGGTIPVVMPVKDKGPSVRYGYVRGEIFGMDIERIHVMDNYNRNGEEFQRIIRPIYLEDQAEYNIQNNGRSYIKCHMYMGRPEYWENRKLASHHIKTYRNGVPERMKDRNFFEWDNNKGGSLFGRNAENLQNKAIMAHADWGYPHGRGPMTDDDLVNYGY